MRRVRVTALVLLAVLTAAACGARLSPELRKQAATAALNAGSGSGDGTSCQGNQNATEELASKVFAFVGSFSLEDGCGAKYLNAHTNVPDIHVALAPEADTPPNHFDIETGALGYATGPFAYYAKKLGAAVKDVGTLYANVGGAVPKQH